MNRSSVFSLVISGFLVCAAVIGAENTTENKGFPFFNGLNCKAGWQNIRTAVLDHYNFSDQSIQIYINFR